MRNDEAALVAGLDDVPAGSTSCTGSLNIIGARPPCRLPRLP